MVLYGAGAPVALASQAHGSEPNVASTGSNGPLLQRNCHLLDKCAQLGLWFAETTCMKFPSPESMSSNAAAANAGPSGLTPEHKAALSQAMDMISQGHTQDAAVDHLVSNSMPRLVAKV